MRFTFVILLFCCLGADAQMIIKAHANYRPFVAAAPGANLLLDDYPNAAAAYSLRKLDKDYTGSAIRVRRSNDNAETNIGFTSSGDLDTTALKSFCSTFNGFITIWYDQSGNGRNAIQNTAANQPRVVNAGTVERRNDDVSIFLDGSNDNLQSNYSFNSAVSIFGVVNVVGTSSSNRIGLYHNSAFNIGMQSLNDWGIQVVSDLAAVITTSAGIQQFTTGILPLTTDASYLIYGNWNGNNTVVKYGRNGTNATNSGTTASNLRTGNTSPVFYTGYTSEFIIYPSDQSSNRTGIENNINDYYNIYWNGDFTGILDDYPSSAAAYSLRNLDKDYLGPLIRVRRSNDNAEQDIYGDYYGNLDTVGLKNFVGANSGFVTTWYDQSGNARNATQSTATSQPRIINSGTVERNFNKPTVRFDGSNDNFAISSISITTYSLFFAYSRPSAGIGQALLSTTSATQWFIQSGGENKIQDVTIGVSETINIFTTNGQLISLFKEGGVLGGSIFRNSSSLALTNPTVGTTYTINRLGVRDEGAFFLNGTISETIIYTSNQSSNRTGIETNINTYYSIY
jgi:hypothetical protein